MEKQNKKGYITELLIFSRLLEYGDISIPYGNNSRYDCILDYNGKLLKLQIKTAKKVDENRFYVSLCNTLSNRTVCKKKKYTKEDVDYVVTIYKEQIYFIPITVPKVGITLSFEYPKNGLKKLIQLAEKYKIENTLL